MGGHAKQHHRKGDAQRSRHNRSVHDAKKTKVVKDLGVPKLSSIAQRLMNTAARHSHSVLSLQNRRLGVAKASSLSKSTSTSEEQLSHSRRFTDKEDDKNNKNNNRISGTYSTTSNKEMSSNRQNSEELYEEEEDNEEFDCEEEEQHLRKQNEQRMQKSNDDNYITREENANESIDDDDDDEEHRLALQRREMTTLALRSNEKLHSYEAPMRLLYAGLPLNHKDYHNNHIQGESMHMEPDISNDTDSWISNYEQNTSHKFYNNKMSDAVDQRTSESSFRRFYKQFQKVVESCDVLLQVLDARDPLGCRLAQLEQSIRSDYGDERKKIVLILNKVDLLPSEHIANAWIRYFDEVEHVMCLSFAATAKGSHGQSYVTNLFRALRGLARNSENNERKAIVVGVIGYPNVGKSSIINALKRKNVVGVGNTPGFTTGMTEVELRSDIRILDCPGVVSPHEQGGDVVLRNAVKVSELTDVFGPVQRLLQRCTAVTNVNDSMHSIHYKKADNKISLVNEDIAAQRTFYASGVHPLAIYYNIGAFDSTDVFDFIRKVGLRRGRLGKGGVVDEEATARMILNDWNDGRIVYYTYPPVVQEFVNGGFASNYICDSSYSNNEQKRFSDTEGNKNNDITVVNGVNQEQVNTVKSEDDVLNVEPHIVQHSSCALTLDGLPTFHLSIKGIEQGRERKGVKSHTDHRKYRQKLKYVNSDKTGLIVNANTTNVNKFDGDYDNYDNADDDDDDDDDDDVVV